MSSRSRLFIVVAGAAGMLIATIVESQRLQVAADEARIEALEQADRQRSALLRSVSHDLRTPLATIRAVATDLDGEVAFDRRPATSCSAWSSTRPSGSTGSWPTC